MQAPVGPLPLLPLVHLSHLGRRGGLEEEEYQDPVDLVEAAMTNAHLPRTHQNRIQAPNQVGGRNAPRPVTLTGMGTASQTQMEDPEEAIAGDPR